MLPTNKQNDMLHYILLAHKKHTNLYVRNIYTLIYI